VNIIGNVCIKYQLNLNHHCCIYKGNVVP